MANKRGDIHIDVALTNVAVSYKNDKLIADRILPVIPVSKQSDKYYKFGKEAFRLYDDLRANGAEAKEVQSYSVSTDNYFCEVHALKDIVTDEDRANADAPISPDTDTTEALTNMILLRREYDVASLLFNSSSYPSGHSSTPTNKWDDYTNSDPVSDIENAKSVIHDAIGLEPNIVVVGLDVWRKLKHHPDLLDRVKYTQKGQLTPDLVASLLEVDEVLIGSALYETAVEGQTSSFGKIWGNHCLVAYRTPGKSTLKTPNLGIIPMWKLYGTKTAKVKKYRWEPRNGDFIEVEIAYDVKLTAPEAGYLLTNVIA